MEWRKEFLFFLLNNFLLVVIVLGHRRRLIGNRHYTVSTALPVALHTAQTNKMIVDVPTGGFVEFIVTHTDSARLSRAGIREYTDGGARREHGGCAGL